MTRLGRAIALTGFVACALATPVGGSALSRACAAGTVHVAVVVDIGSGSTVSAVCVAVGSGDNGASLLAARASMLGVPQPRYSASGLLCAIDGVPATGCGTAHDGHYAYWSYWHGSGGKWSYNNFGPASWRVAAGVVEGWRWQPDGSGLPTDPAPRGPATATAICVPASPTTTAPRTTVATSPPATVASVPMLPTITGQQSPATVPVTGSPSTTAVPSTVRSGSASTVAAGATVTTSGAHSPRAAAGSTTTSSVELSARGIAAAGPSHASGAAPLGLIVGVPLVIGLGAGGAYAARRRSRSRPAGSSS